MLLYKTTELPANKLNIVSFKEKEKRLGKQKKLCIEE